MNASDGHDDYENDDKDGLAGYDGLQLFPAKETSVQSGNGGIFRVISKQGWQQPLCPFRSELMN